jgi:hypothetical protein
VNITISVVESEPTLESQEIEILVQKSDNIGNFLGDARVIIFEALKSSGYLLRHDYEFSGPLKIILSIRIKPFSRFRSLIIEILTENTCYSKNIETIKFTDHENNISVLTKGVDFSNEIISSV